MCPYFCSSLQTSGKQSTRAYKVSVLPFFEDAVTSKSQKSDGVVVVVVMLLFNVHGKQLWSCRDGQKSIKAPKLITDNAPRQKDSYKIIIKKIVQSCFFLFHLIQIWLN